MNFNVIRIAKARGMNKMSELEKIPVSKLVVRQFTDSLKSQVMMPVKRTVKSTFHNI
jgi:hypothetical protein